MSTITVPGLRGSIYQRGKDSFRVQLSLGRNAEGKYDIKRETVRGTRQDAIDLLTRWNVEYLDHTIQATKARTVQQAYEQWIEHIREYRAPNTHRFYRERFESDLLPVLGHKRLQEVGLRDMQLALAKHPTKDRHNKRALSAFFGWCADMDWVGRHDFGKLKTKAKPQPKREDDVWGLEQVRQVYATLTFEPLYDIFIVLGIECGLRPQEAMALTWDSVQPERLVIDAAIKERTPTDATVGPTKTGQERTVATTPYLIEKLATHRANQQAHIAATRDYADSGLVVADRLGHVANLGYIRRYMHVVADRAGVPRIPPKNLRSTYISLLTSLGIPLSVIQQAVGHSSPEVTSRHYIRVFDASLREAARVLHEHLHT